MTRFIEYDKETGRILRYGDESHLREMLQAEVEHTDLTHYVVWDTTDARRPVAPRIEPRTWLTAEVTEGKSASRVEIASGVPLVVIVDGRRQGPINPENGRVVLEFASPLPRIWSVEVNEPGYHLPPLSVAVE